MFQHRGYTPSATFLGDKGRDWASLLEINEIAELEDLSWADEWAYMLDMDLFDDSIVRMTIGQLKGDTFLDPVLILRRLAFMALSGKEFTPLYNTNHFSCTLTYKIDGPRR